MRERQRPSDDEVFGSNLRTLRERAGISQKKLAEEMSLRGFSWLQQTVGRIENAVQPARFAEANALAAILGVPLSRFTWPEPEAAETGTVLEAGAYLRQRYEEVADAVCGHLLDFARARRIAGEHQDSEYGRVRDACGSVLRQVQAYGLEAAIGVGRARYREYEPDGGEVAGDGAGQDAEGEPGLVDQR